MDWKHKPIMFLSFTGIFSIIQHWCEKKKKQACSPTSESMNAFRTLGISFSLFEHPGCPLLMDGLVHREARKSILYFPLICAKTQKDWDKTPEEWSSFPSGHFEQFTKSAIQNCMSVLEMFDLMPWSVPVSDRWTIIDLLNFWLEMVNK